MAARASSFRDLVSGRRRGAVAALARAALRMLEVPYTAAVCWRNRRFDRGRGVQVVAVPVVSVGNLSLGGTGKTPMVEWLARWLQGRGVRVVLVSRGYQGRRGVNDEALELAEKLPDVPHVQHADRVRAAGRAFVDYGAQLVLLDDGFQHRRLARDLDIVLLDALEPFGFDHVFPRGTLREPPVALGRAQVVALSRADLVDSAVRAEIHGRAMRYAPQCTWLELRHAPRALRAVGSSERPLSDLMGRRVAAFCGIGNPQAFRRTLESCGARVVAFREFADHHAYSPADVAALADWAAAAKVDALVSTHKDLVKLPHAELAGKPLWALVVGVEILTGQEQLERLLAPIIARALAQPPAS